VCHGKSCTEMSLDKAKELINDAQRIAVLTGAGISTDSGIPDFRGPEGIWTKNPEAEKLSTISNYLNDPEMRQRSWDLFVTGWGDYKPNAGHLALANLSCNKEVTVITQNIDGLHWCDGNLFKDVIEIHGNLREIKCVGCGGVWSKDELSDATYWTNGCDNCGGILKPNIIFFGELLDPTLWTNATNAVINSDLLLVVGTSLQVWPCADLVDVASKWHKKIIIVNGSSTGYDAYADAVLNGSISNILTELIDGT
jgi:NAD-dependent deacetylase